MKKRKYAIKTINLGEADSPSRILAEKYIKNHGKVGFSSLIRKLILIYLSNDKLYIDYRKQLLIYDRKSVGREIEKLVSKRNRLDDELKNAGINPEDILL